MAGSSNRFLISKQLSSSKVDVVANAEVRRVGMVVSDGDMLWCRLGMLRFIRRTSRR